MMTQAYGLRSTQHSYTSLVYVPQSMRLNKNQQNNPSLSDRIRKTVFGNEMLQHSTENKKARSEWTNVSDLTWDGQIIIINRFLSLLLPLTILIIIMIFIAFAKILRSFNNISTPSNDARNIRRRPKRYTFYTFNVLTITHLFRR